MTSNPASSTSNAIDLTGSDEQTYVYWEKQESSLCGAHCVNTLLQSPIYTEVDLAEIAHQLDAQMQQLMSEGGTDTNDYLAYMAADSSNVDDEGNFGVDVLREALKTFDITLEPITTSAQAQYRSDPTTASAFVCNFMNHWLTLRKVYFEDQRSEKWINCNSLLPFGSEPISDTYLSIYLNQLEVEKYTIFVVHGNLPQPAYQHQQQQQSDRGQWFTYAQCVANSKKPRLVDRRRGKSTQRQRSGESNASGQSTADATAAEQLMSIADGDEDEELRRAIAASLAPSGANTTSSAITSDAQLYAAPQSAHRPTASDDDSMDASLQRSLMASVSGAPTGSQQARSAAVHPASQMEDEDPELAAAIAASLRQ